MLPSWAVGTLVAILMAVLGFAWRLAVKAERSADKLETAVERLQTLESRIAVIAALERSDAVRESELRHLRELHNALADEVGKLRPEVHTLARQVQGLLVRAD